MSETASKYYLPPDHPEVTDVWEDGTARARFAGRLVEGEPTVDWQERPAMLHKGGAVAIYEYSDVYTVHDVPSGYAIRNLEYLPHAMQFAAGWLRLLADHPLDRDEDGVPASKQPEPVVAEVRSLLETIKHQPLLHMPPKKED